MKTIVNLAAFLLLVALGSAEAAQASKATPITRVVELLKDMQKKAEADGKAEEDLYFKFLCWGRSIVETKTASNSAAKSRIENLEGFITDVESGATEFTSEKEDLTKELKDVDAELAQAKAQRSKEEAEFDDAKAEMDEGIEGLGKAIDVMEEAASASASSLVQVHRAGAGVRESAAELSRERRSLLFAAELGERILSAGDAVFLRRVLTGDVPKVPKRASAKKLNRKAKFAAKYKMRSTKILNMIKEVRANFVANRKEATDKESKATTEYKEIIKTLQKRKEDTEEALGSMSKENAAKAVKLEEAQEELASLTTQVEDDEKFIEQTQTALKTKAGQWEDRQTSRAGELAAFSQAIEILYNDDARDLIKKSYASQGFLFLQVASSTAGAQRQAAAAVLRRAASASGNQRLAVLALQAAASRSHFGDVLVAIANMTATLKAQADGDLAKKESCEDELKEASRDAATESRAIDGYTETMRQMTGEIANIDSELGETKEAKASATKAAAEAGANRKAEAAEWRESNADDAKMKQTVLDAKDVLEKFYEKNNNAFLQQQGPGAGEAPLPPPATWARPHYDGSGGAESVISILEVAAEDIQKDMDKAKADEAAAIADYEAFKKESDDLLKKYGEDITNLETARGDKEKKMGEAKDDRRSSMGTLKAVMRTYGTTRADCDWLLINYEARSRDRAIEIDGLSKAKGVLKNAKFDAKDPDRDLEPGDAAAAMLFLQRRK